MDTFDDKRQQLLLEMITSEGAASLPDSSDHLLQPWLRLVRFTELRFSEADISFLTDAIIAMRYVEMNGCLCKLISVVKVRGSSHSNELRQFRITDEGLDIDGAPLRFDGLLSGHPSARAPLK